MNERQRFRAEPGGHSRYLWLLATVIALASLLGSASRASAHALPVRANPPINGAVAAAPAALEIWFGEEVKTEGTTIQVIGPGGVEVDLGDAKVDLFDPNREHVTVSLRPNLGPGTYTVQWNSVSNEDGDAAQGAFVFTVTGGSPVASPSGSPAAVRTPTTAPAAQAVSTEAPLPTPTPTPDATDDGNFDSRAYGLSVLVGVVVAIAIYAFWRFVRPKNPKFRG